MIDGFYNIRLLLYIITGVVGLTATPLGPRSVLSPTLVNSSLPGGHLEGDTIAAICSSGVIIIIYVVVDTINASIKNSD